MKKVGIILLIIGLALTIFTAFTFFTKEKVVDIGKVEITRDKPHRLQLVPFDWNCRNGDWRRLNVEIK